MKSFKLSLTALSCILALTACSSSKNTANDYLNSEANQRIKTLTQRLDEEKKEREEAERKLKDAEGKLQETEDKLREAKQSEEKNRIDNNAKEVQKSVKDNGTFEITYSRGDGSSGRETVSFATGKLLTVSDGKLSHKDIGEKTRDLNKLVIDGTEITLYSVDEVRTATQASEYSSKAINQDGFQGKVGAIAKNRNADAFNQVRYGYITKDGKNTLFVQGHITPTEEGVSSPFDSFYYGTAREDQWTSLSTMPSDQIWHYQGNAFYGKDGVYEEFAVDAVADFTENKIRADLKSNDDVLLTLGAQITGNQFSGSYNGVVTSGAFYGSNAQNMAGVFYETSGDNKDKNGVFAATPQSSSPWTFRPTNESSKTLANFEVSK